MGITTRIYIGVGTHCDEERKHQDLPWCSSEHHIRERSGSRRDRRWEAYSRLTEINTLKCGQPHITPPIWATGKPASDPEHKRLHALRSRSLEDEHLKLPLPSCPVPFVNFPSPPFLTPTLPPPPQATLYCTSVHTFANVGLFLVRVIFSVCK